MLIDFPLGVEPFSQAHQVDVSRIALAATDADDGIILLFTFFTEADPASLLLRCSFAGFLVLGTSFLLFLDDLKTAGQHAASSLHASFDSPKVATKLPLASKWCMCLVLNQLLHGVTSLTSNYSVRVIGMLIERFQLRNCSGVASSSVSVTRKIVNRWASIGH